LITSDPIVIGIVPAKNQSGLSSPVKHQSLQIVQFTGGVAISQGTTLLSE